MNQKDIFLITSNALDNIEPIQNTSLKTPI